MRTFLTRLTVSTAGVVLTGIGTAAAAYAGDEDPITIDDSPHYVEESRTLEPIDRCEIEFTIEDCTTLLDDGLVETFPDDTELIDPGALDGGDGGGTDEPAGGESEDPEAGATEDPGAGEPGEPESGESEGSEGGSDEGGSETGSGASGDAETGESASEPTGTDDGHEPAGSGSDGESAGDSGDGGSDSSQDASDEPTSEADESTVTPAVQSTSGAGGAPDPMFGVLAAVLAVFGIGMVSLGFVRRAQVARGVARGRRR